MTDARYQSLYSAINRLVSACFAEQIAPTTGRDVLHQELTDARENLQTELAMLDQRIRRLEGDDE